MAIVQVTYQIKIPDTVPLDGSMESEDAINEFLEYEIFGSALSADNPFNGQSIAPMNGTLEWDEV